MATIDRDGNVLATRKPPPLHRQQGEAVETLQSRSPAKGKRARRRDADADASEAAGAAAHPQRIRPPAARERGNRWNQLFRMATPDSAMIRPRKHAILEQRHRQVCRRCIDDENAQVKSRSQRQTMLLNRSKPGRGDRSKMLAGSP